MLLLCLEKVPPVGHSGKSVIIVIIVIITAVV